MINRAYRNTFFLMLCCFLLSACSGFKPMDHEFNTRLQKIKIGMTVRQVKAIFPSMKLVNQLESHQTYTYTEHDLRGVSFVGVMKRQVTFLFRFGVLKSWSSNRSRPFS